MIELADGFPREWEAQILREPPMIAPARQFVFPVRVPGEDEAMGRGALLLQVKPATGGSFLATCALGFADRSMPTRVLPCPNPREICAVAGGFAYLIDTADPERSTLIELRPVVEVRTLLEQRLLLFTGFQNLAAWGEDGLAWVSGRLSWEGVRVEAIEGDSVLGFGWDLLTDKEVPFTLDLRSGRHQGGGYQARPQDLPREPGSHKG